MFKKLVIQTFILLSIVLTFYSRSYAGDKFSHHAFNKVLEAYVDENGRVNYSALKQNSEGLDEYIHLLEKFSPDSNPQLFPSSNDKLAYWINAYNAFVIKGVIEKYPIKSVRDVGLLPFSFFWRMKFNAGGEKITLKKLEDEIIRKRFKEPRIHFAINCASGGCPKLVREAFYPENLNERLEKATRVFINETRNVRIDTKEKKIYLSSIFDWYKDDYTEWYNRQFNTEEATILDYLRLYLSEDKLALMNNGDKYEIEIIDYDWLLNDQNTVETSHR